MVWCMRMHAHVTCAFKLKGMQAAHAACWHTHLVRTNCQPPTTIMAKIASGRDMACKGNRSGSLKGILDSKSPTTPSPRLTATKGPCAAATGGNTLASANCSKQYGIDRHTMACIGVPEVSRRSAMHDTKCEAASHTCINQKYLRTVSQQQSPGTCTDSCCATTLEPDWQD